MSPSPAPDGVSEEDPFDRAVRVATSVWGQLEPQQRTVENAMKALRERGQVRKLCQDIFDDFAHRQATEGGIHAAS